jgi:hypothetical protein
VPEKDRFMNTMLLGVATDLLPEQRVEVSVRSREIDRDRLAISG